MFNNFNLYIYFIIKILNIKLYVVKICYTSITDDNEYELEAKIRKLWYALGRRFSINS